MDRYDFAALLSRFNPAEVYVMSVLAGGVLVGRVLYWAKRMRRRPKLWELAIEPFIMAAVGALGAAAISALNIEDPRAYGAIGALCGYAGVQVLDAAITFASKRFGVEPPCQIRIKEDER